VAATFALSGCVDEWKARSAVKGLLTDPGSVEFYDLKKSDRGNICGQFNAKNRIGGYVGKTHFYYQPHSETVAIVTGVDDSELRDLYRRISAKMDFSDEYDDLSLKCRLAGDWNRICGQPFPHNTSRFCSFLGDGRALYKELRTVYSD